MIRTVIRATLGLLTGGSATRLVATVLVGMAAGGWGAWQVQHWRQNSQALERIQRAAKDAVRRVEIEDRAAGTYVQEQAHANTVYQRITVEVDKIVDRPVYRDECFDADGMRQLRGAIAGHDPEPSAGQPVPSAH